MASNYDKAKGEKVAEMLLPCRAFPLRRGRSKTRKYRGVYQPLAEQERMMELMYDYSGLDIDFPIVVEIECSYKNLYQRPRTAETSRIMAYDVDNLMKAILDNMQRMIIIKDDRLVVAAQCIKYSGDCDTTFIRIYRAEGYLYGAKTIPT